MDKFNAKSPIYPMLGFIIAILTLTIGLLFVENPNVIYFFIGIYLLHMAFGNWRACFAIIPFLLVMSSLFGFVTYIVAHDIESTTHAIYRSFAVCLAMIPGLSTPTTALIKNLRQMHISKAITLGMLITLNFIPLFRKEMNHIHDAMKTRGVVSILHPSVVYRAFLIPLIIRIVNISETLSLSVETRGFTLEKSCTTIYQPIAFRTRDTAFTLLFITITIGAFII